MEKNKILLIYTATTVFECYLYFVKLFIFLDDIIQIFRIKRNMFMDVLSIFKFNLKKIIFTIWKNSEKIWAILNTRETVYLNLIMDKGFIGSMIKMNIFFTYRL